MTSTIVYKGNLISELTHTQSGTVVLNEPPVDNHGKGECFSPTDLFATTLGSCMITTMALRAQLSNMSLNFDGTTAEITKTMSSDAPRRIVAIDCVLFFTENFKATDDQKEQLIRIAHSCPVEKSLHPDIKVNVVFNW